MKKAVLFLILSSSLGFANAQLKAKTSCGTLSIDWLGGTVNGIRPDFTLARIKEKLPCFSTVEEENAGGKCGGKVEFKEDIRFFTSRDYAEVGEKFKGKQSFPLLGAKRGSLYKYLGNPQLKDPEWDAFQTAYGIIVLYYKGGVVKKVRFSTKSVDTIQLCE